MKFRNMKNYSFPYSFRNWIQHNKSTSIPSAPNNIHERKKERRFAEIVWLMVLAPSISRERRPEPHHTLSVSCVHWRTWNAIILGPACIARKWSYKLLLAVYLYHWTFLRVYIASRLHLTNHGRKNFFRTHFSFFCLLEYGPATLSLTHPLSTKKQDLESIRRARRTISRSDPQKEGKIIVIFLFFLTLVSVIFRLCLLTEMQSGGGK